MDISTDTLLIAFGLTILAGLSTSIGSAIAFFTKRTNEKFLSASLGFSAGVMIYVSFMELLPLSFTYMAAGQSNNISLASWYSIGAFFAGILSVAIIDRLVPEFENPHEPRGVGELKNPKDAQKYKRLYHTAMFTALIIAIHNFPEGLVTFAAALSNPALGVAIAIAIAIHNIPEGIAVSIPFYYATGDRKKAFIFSSLSGLTEPLGAFVAYLVLMPFLSDSLFGFFFAFVAGIMVFISIDELLPAAQKFGHHHHSVYGLVAGMAVMALSLILVI